MIHPLMVFGFDVYAQPVEATKAGAELNPAIFEPGRWVPPEWVR